jgi:SNF2 family DNA or RNA helicase
MDQNAATEYTFHLPINEKITEQSSLVGGNDRTLKLKTYQIEGVNWLINLYNNNMSGILADEMGLGKTIQVIGMICYLVEHKNNNGPYLVIAPLSTISNWQSEFEKWAPTLTTYVYKGSPAERKRLFEDNMKDGNFNVLIVQFELVMDAKDAKRLKSLDWSHIIVDEGHRLKNRESKLFGVLTGKTGYRARNRVILSGTPLQNEIHELWSLLNFLLPEIFETSDDFEEWFAKPFRTADDGADYDVVDEEKEFLIKCLHAVLRPFMTRRLKADLKDTMELPETREEIIWCRERERARACARECAGK